MPSRPTATPAPRPLSRRHRLSAGALAATLCLTVAGCSGDEEKEGGPESPSAGGSSATEAAVPSTVSWVAVAGKLPQQRREKVKAAVTEVVDGWFDAAYVGGEWPRTDFSGAFAGFTEGARTQAEKDLELMTNSAIGGQVEAVEVRKREIKLDALGAKGRAAGVTARFTLKFTTTGEAAGTETVSGRLFLLPKDGRWRVFGYDVARSERKGAA